MKTGLVLEGGAMRGMYTAGVLDVFLENGVSFDDVIGVSAGAISGVSFVSGQKGRTIRYNLKYCRDKRVMSFYSLFTTGDLVGDRFCYHEIPERLDPFDNASFQASPTKFYAVCTNLETGEAEVIHLTDMFAQIDYLRASASMPYVSRIVEMDGKQYLDGGCSDSIPVRKAMEMGITKPVVVLTRPADYRKKPSRASLAEICYRRYPNFIRCLRSRAQEYNRSVEEVLQLEQAGKIFVIRPQTPLDIGRMCHDPEKIQAAYLRGREDASRQLEQLKAWLNT